MNFDSKAFEYIENTFGSTPALKYKEFIDITPTNYIRINPLKTNFDQLKIILNKKYSIEIQKVENIPNAALVRSDENNLIGKTLEHILGYYYIQSLSSMLPALILAPTENDIVLDLCAAPGSKTTQLSELMNNKGTIIANEIDIDRIKALVFNIDRLNLLNIGVINNKGEILSKIYDNYFDKILVDAPCSSLGIIQKRGEVTSWWSIEHSERLHNIQLKLLISAIKMAKVGGEIVYSTCTLSVEENELVIDKVLKNYPVEVKEINLPFKTIPGKTEFNSSKLNDQIESTHRILPWEINSDGFFIAKLLKTDSTEPLEKLKLPKSDIKLMNYKNKHINKYIVQLSDYFGINLEVFKNFNFIHKGKDIFLTDRNWYDENLNIFNRIGLKLGSVDNRNNLALHSNAGQILSEYITKKIYHLKNYDELEKYISGSKLQVDELEFGQYLIMYENYPLGTATKSNDGLKSQFPKTKRTQKIELK
ncbi:MAG: RsmB/NOP family class I SAM-dependent RNA methyltransferase [Ignavibacterium sp.]|nr:RsmB/NOP family class I SAM-dependent RNA methyltransferase [Ignavibacterium sp.]MDW8374262.1 NOL1/NOP2/sun family putative RNA methylase [Ignavibacteriales bacterium]